MQGALVCNRLLLVTGVSAYLQYSYMLIIIMIDCFIFEGSVIKYFRIHVLKNEADSLFLLEVII